jgi:hypothetical protein
MKAKEFMKETTSAGGVAAVAMPLGAVQSRTGSKKKKNKTTKESGLQYYTGVKKHGKEYMKKAAQAGRDGASQEELGRLKDKYSKATKKEK